MILIWAASNLIHKRDTPHLHPTPTPHTTTINTTTTTTATNHRIRVYRNA